MTDASSTWSLVVSEYLIPSFGWSGCYKIGCRLLLAKNVWCYAKKAIDSLFWKGHCGPDLTATTREMQNIFKVKLVDHMPSNRLWMPVQWLPLIANNLFIMVCIISRRINLIFYLSRWTRKPSRLSLTRRWDIGWDPQEKYSLDKGIRHVRRLVIIRRLINLQT